MESITNSQKYKKAKEQFEKTKIIQNDLKELEKKYEDEIKQIETEITELKIKRNYEQILDEIKNIRNQILPTLNDTQQCCCPGKFKIQISTYLVCSICGHEEYIDD